MENIKNIKQTREDIAKEEFEQTEITQKEAKQKIKEFQENLKAVVEEVKNKN